MSATAGASESTHTQDEERSRKVLRMRSIIFVHELNFEKRLIVRPTSAVLKVVDWGIRFPHRPSFAFTRKSIFPSQTRRLAIAFWRLPREPASTHTLSHIVRAARQCASHTRAQHVRGRSGRAADALHLLCLQCANWRFSQHCGCVVPGCSSDSRRRPRAL